MWGGGSLALSLSPVLSVKQYCEQHSKKGGTGRRTMVNVCGNISKIGRAITCSVCEGWLLVGQPAWREGAGCLSSLPLPLPFSLYCWNSWRRWAVKPEEEWKWWHCENEWPEKTEKNDGDSMALFSFFILFYYWRKKKEGKGRKRRMTMTLENGLFDGGSSTIFFIHSILLPSTYSSMCV